MPTGVFTEFRRNFSRNSAGIFYGIPPEFFMEFRRNFLRNSAGIFYGIPPEFFTEFRRNFSRNSARISAEHGIPWKKFRGIPRNFIPAENFHEIPRNFFTEFRGIFQAEFFSELRNSAWEIQRNYNSGGIFFGGIMDTLVSLLDLPKHAEWCRSLHTHTHTLTYNHSF